MSMSESELKQIELLRKKTPVERFLLMGQLIDDQFEVMKAGIKHRNPGMSDEELHKCLMETMKKIYSTMEH